MDIDLTPTPTSTKSPDDTDIDTPPHKTQPISGGPRPHPQRAAAAAAATTYKECLKNHAANIGGHAVDGCGEFMPSPSATAADPVSLKCAACGCHRNFHRREPDESPAAAITPPFLDFRHPPLPKRFSLSPSPPPPPPPPAHVLFGLSMGMGAEEHHQAPVTPTAEYPAGRKRFRTKFSQEQREKMRSFSATLGWRMQRCDEAAVREFCREIGVTRGVLKVWMHNNKNTLAKKEINGGGGGDFKINGNFVNNDDIRKSEERLSNDHNGNGVHFHGSNEGSSSPSP